MDDVTPIYFFTLIPVFALLATIAATQAIFGFAQSRLLDIPVARSSHTLPTPKGGGLGFALAMLGALLLAQPQGFEVLVLTSVMILVVSFLDDLKGLHQLPRVSVHFAAALTFVLFMPAWPSLAPLDRLEDSSLFIGFLFVGYLVWSINLYNFMDGIDGLATAEGIFVSLGLAALSCWASEWVWTVVFLSGGLALLAFLRWNWAPAKMFMGDSGSAFLGWWFGGSTLMLAGTTHISLWLPMMLISVFVVDASFTLFRRIVNGEKVFDAHRSHVYQVLTDHLGSHPKTVMFYVGVNVVVVLPAVLLAISKPEYVASICACLYIGLMGLCLTAWAWLRFVTYRQQKNRVAAFQVRRLPLVALVATDGVALIFAFFLAYLVRLDVKRMAVLNYEILLAPIVALVSIYAFYRLGVYRIAVRNMLNSDLWVLSVASAVSSVILAASGFMTQAFMPRSLPLVYFVILLGMVGGGRVLFRAISRARVQPNQLPALIINVKGMNERQLADLNLNAALLPVGIVDVRAEMKGEVINGLKVYGPSELDEIIVSLNVSYLLVVASTTPRYIQRYMNRVGQNAGVTICCLNSEAEGRTRYYAPQVSTWVVASKPRPDHSDKNFESNAQPDKFVNK